MHWAVAYRMIKYKSRENSGSPSLSVSHSIWLVIKHLPNSNLVNISLNISILSPPLLIQIVILFMHFKCLKDHECPLEEAQADYGSQQTCGHVRSHI